MCAIEEAEMKPWLRTGATVNVCAGETEVRRCPPHFRVLHSAVSMTPNIVHYVTEWVGSMFEKGPMYLGAYVLVNCVLSCHRCYLAHSY